jgi:hypothetical protein
MTDAAGRKVIWSAVAGAMLTPLAMAVAVAHGNPLTDALTKATQEMQRLNQKLRHPQAQKTSETTNVVATQSTTAGSATGTSTNSESNADDAHPEVAGITLGTSDPAAALAAVLKWNGMWDAIKEPKGTLAEPAGYLGSAVIPNTTYVRQLNNFGPSHKNIRDAFVIIFAPPPSKSRALYIVRDWFYGPSETTTPENFRKALLAKYGNHVITNVSYPNQFLWEYAADGSPMSTIKFPCNFYGGIDLTGDIDSDEQKAKPFVQAGCAVSVHVRLEVNGGVVTYSEVSAIDYSGIVSAGEAADHFVANYVAEKTKGMQEQAKKRGAPVL